MRRSITVVACLVILSNCHSRAVAVTYLEPFDADTSDVPASYPGFTVTADTDGPADVSSGMLRIFDGTGLADNTLVTIDATSVEGNAVFSEALRTTSRIGGTSGNAGGWSVGMVLGDVEFIFHPGYSTGVFRGAVPGSGAVTANMDMGFTPAADVLHNVEVTAITGTGSVKFDVRIVDGNNSGNVFFATINLPTTTVGPLDRVGFGRGGNTGGHGVYDDFQVETISVPSAGFRDGSFEAPDIGAANFIRIVPGIEPIYFGWDIDSGGVNIVSNNLFGSSLTAFEGDQYLDLDGPAPGVISQSFPTVPGQQYLLSFEYANNPFPSSTIPASATVEVTDVLSSSSLLSEQVTHGSTTTSNADWTHFLQVFTATGTETKLRFASLDPSGTGGILLDGVQISPVPEPVSLFLLGTGLLGLPIVRRRL